MSENLLTLRCPNCSEAVELQISKVKKQPASIEDVKEVLGEWLDDLDITEEDECIVVMPKAYLGKELWYKINEALKSVDGEWVSAGKEGRWVIKS